MVELVVWRASKRGHMGFVQQLVRGFLGLCVIVGIVYLVLTGAHSLLTRGDLTEFLDHGATANEFLRNLRAP